VRQGRREEGWQRQSLNRNYNCCSQVADVITMGTSSATEWVRTRACQELTTQLNRARLKQPSQHQLGRQRPAKRLHSREVLATVVRHYMRSRTSCLDPNWRRFLCFLFRCGPTRCTILLRIAMMCT
jgi:hypothetical protein